MDSKPPFSPESGPEAELAWPFPGASGRGVRVAVIDSGVNPRHPHISGIAGGASVFGPEQIEEGCFWDTLGHGTAVMAAIPANPTRKGLMLCNAATGTTPASVNITFGTITPTTATGIQLPGGAVPNSCLTLMPYMGPNIAMGAQINAIASAAATPLTALEF